MARVWRFIARFRYPHRLAAYLLLRVAFFGKWRTVPVTPVAVDIEPINSCNFHCKHCQVTHWTKAKAQLDVETFRRIVAQFPHLHEVNLQGMGEPLLNKQHIDMLAEGERRGLIMRFHSNASACTEVTARRLLELEQTSITFSIDAGDATTFERVRPGSNFAQICRNIRYLTGERKAKGGPKISGWTVLTTENIGQLPRIIALCGELGLDRVTLQPYLTGWGKRTLDEYVTTIKLDALEAGYAVLLREARHAASAAKIELSIVDSVYSKRKPCPWPWNSAYVAANGDVVPCCIIADADVVKMGNVFERPFAEIWNGEAYRRLRMQLRNHDIPPFCRACYADAPQSQTQTITPAVAPERVPVYE